MESTTTFRIAELYKKNFARLLPLVTARIGCPQAAEDILQDTFVKLLDRQDLWKTINDPDKYISVICYNNTISYLNRKKLKDRVQADLEYLSSGTFKHDATLFKDLVNAVNISMSKLPRRQKQVYQLRRQEGLSIEDTAQKLAITSFTVKAAMQKAVKTLRKNISRDLGL